MRNDASPRDWHEKTQSPFQTYGLYGLRIGSEVPLPVSPLRTSDSDIELRWGGMWEPPGTPLVGTVLASALFGNGLGYTHMAIEQGYALRFHGTAEFRIDQGCQVIEAALAPGVSSDYIAILFAGNVLAFVLTITGDAVLHASAVEVGGAAIAFVGSSGMGKSTVAALLCAGGARLIADDVLRLDLGGGKIACHAGPPEIRLRQAASELSSRFPSTSCRQTGDGRLAIRLPMPSGEITPLRAIVIPKPNRDARSVRCVRLSALQAFLALTRHPRVLGWTGQEQMRRQVQWLGTVANQVPIFEADIPWGPPFAPTLVSELCREVGLDPPPGSEAL